MRYRLIPYRQGSASCRRLADALKGKVLKLEGSKYIPRKDDVLINWGNTSLKGPASVRILNPSNLIRQASNKLLFFGHMKASGHEDIIPDFWTQAEDIPADAFPIVCRTILAGHSGAGIVLATDRSQLVPAPLYVRYIPKKDEYRVHVGKTFSDSSSGGNEGGAEEGTAIIAIQRKARRVDTPDESVNWKVRNHSNGFVFVRGDVDPPADVLRTARLALLATGLDFGAVDVIWNEKKKKAFVLEINTAPGLEGQTVQDYEGFFKGL